MDMLEQIREQLEWGNNNLERAVDNLLLVDVFWLIEQAEKVEKLEEELQLYKSHYPRPKTAF